MTTIILANLDGADGFRLDGIDANDFSGRSVSGAGDVNGDGFADLIIGASGGDPNGNSSAGESYVVFGKASGFTAGIDLASLDGTDGFRLDGLDANDFSGRSVSTAGDVNGDGLADLIIGVSSADPNGNSNAGESYVVFGKVSGFTASVDLANLDGTDGFRLDGIDVDDRSGYSVADAGDVNGDGFADLIIGAISADPNGNSNAGESYVVFGKASGFTAELDLASLDGANGFRLDGIDVDDRSGYSVSGAGDVNGDGFADLIIGALYADPNGDSLAGESYVVFGKASGFTAGLDLASLDGANGFRLDGIDGIDFSGGSVSGAGDVNGDGFADLIIGAAGGDPGSESAAGESYVVFGKASGFTANVDLASLDGADGFRIDGIDANDSSGQSVSGAGDVNGDGFADLIIGANGADPDGDGSAGESFVVFGKASGFTAGLDLATLDATEGFQIDGIDAGDQSGRSVSAAGDVNGDGFADLIIGAYGADPNGDSAAGESFVVFGFDSGAVTHQGTSASETLTGDANANVIVGGLGNDVLVGAGGIDSLRGGGGDDVLDVADTGFLRADGGSGTDILRLSGDNLTLDLTAAGDQGLSTIEGLDFAAANGGLVLSAVGVLGLSDTSNTLVITGDNDDTVTATDSGWSLASLDATTRTVVNGQAELVIDKDIALVGFGIDIVSPTLTVTLDDTVLSVGETATVTFTFSEAVIGFDNSDITVPNGTLSEVATADGGTTFTATYTPTAVVDVATNIISVDASYTDIAGNLGAAADSANFEVDVAPTLNISIDDVALLAGETAVVTFAFSEAVIGFDNSDITVPNGALTTVASSDGGVTFTGTFTPTIGADDPTNIISVGASYTDIGGNLGAAADSFNFNIDPSQPTLAITLDDSVLNANETASVTFTFSEAVNGFDNSDITVSNGTLSTVVASADRTTFTGTFTPDADTDDETNTISVGDGYIDVAGNVGTAADSANFVIDMVAPTLAIALDDSALLPGETAGVTFTFSEAVTGFDNSDITVPNGALSTVSSADGGITFTGTFTPTVGVDDAMNIISVGADYTDVAGNAGAAADSANFTINTVVPTATISLDDANLAIGETAVVTFTFSEAVTGFDNTDITVPNGALSTVSSADGGVTFTGTFTPTFGVDDATNIISISADYTNIAGNAGTAANSANFAIKTVVVSSIDLSTLDGADGFRLGAIDASDKNGRSVSGAGDVNGDGFADLIIGANGGDPNGVYNGGESYVVFGKASGFTASFDLAGLDGADGFRLDSIDANDNTGDSVSSAGDVNGDGFADLIIGAFAGDPDGDSAAGESYVVFGKASGFTAGVSLASLDGTDGFRLDGIDVDDFSGRSVSSAGDVNGDGFADLIIGGYRADPNGDSAAGESYVVFGKEAGFTAGVDLASLDGADGFRLDGIDADDNSGIAVSNAGDVNGDGFGDLIIGADGADPNGDSAAGESYVVFGKASGFTAGVDLASLDGADGFRLDGIDADDQSGIAVSDAGDVNGDGFADMIIGAFKAASNGDIYVGESYVVFGKEAGFTAGVDLASLDGADGFRLDGIDVNDRSGRSVSSAGDFNGDGFADLIIASYNASPNGVGAAGETYVVFGKASGFTAGLDLASLDGADGLRLDGFALSGLSGRSVSGAGDVNGDGFADLIIGAYFVRLNGAFGSGESYVVFGFDNGAVTHRGTSAGETLTGDGAANVIIGDQGDDTLLGAGGADVFRGGEGDDILVLDDLTFADADGGAGTDTLRLNAANLSLDLTAAGDEGLSGIEAIDFASTGGNLTLNALAVVGLSETSNTLTVTGDSNDTVTFGDSGWTISGQSAGANIITNGQATLVIDSDIVLAGVPVLLAIDLGALDGTDGFRLDGIDATDLSGLSVSGAGDVNGDGFADLIIGASGGDPNGDSSAGESYVVFGKASGFTAGVSLASLDGADGFRLDGIAVSDLSGRSVSGAGDINGDGFADLIIGADGADPNGVSTAGESYVVFGKASGFTAGLDLASLDGANGFRLDGIDANDRSGISVSDAGDVNGDGFADMIIGANDADPIGNSNAGESYVVFGKASGFTASLDLASLDGSNGFLLEGIDANDKSGSSVSSAGDVNGDGFADLIIGAFAADPGGYSAAGESYVVFGKASGFTAGFDLGALDGVDGFRLDGIDTIDYSGRSVSSAGDVNGDGFADLIIGAVGGYYSTGPGESYVVFGKASGFTAGLDLGALDGTDGFRVDGIDEKDYSGISVSDAGDVNGDGFDDLIIGSEYADPNGDNAAGESYVVFGKASGFTAGFDLATLNGSNGFRLDGIDVNDVSGRSVSGTGDINGDGFDDLIIGAYRADPGGAVSAGESYVVFGFDSGAVTHQGTSASETLTGDASANVIIGGLGDDTLVGAGGLDVLRGGGGNDILDVADLGFQRIDGGTGADTLRLSGAALALDFTATGSQLVESIEAIDLAGAGAGVTLDAVSVVQLSEASNTLTITGGASETLTLTDAGWTHLPLSGGQRTLTNGQATIVIDEAVQLAGAGAPALPPAASITIDDTALVTGETTTVTFSFSEAVANFNNFDITVPNGTLSTVSTADGGLTFTGLFTPDTDAQDATNIISISDTYTFVAGSGGIAADSANFTIDTLAPTVSITLDDSALIAGDTATVTFAFSEAVTGFDASDITAPNGALTPLATSDGGVTFTATYTPDADTTDATNIISVGSEYTDAVGNTGTAADSANFTVDTSVPTATISLDDASLTIGETAGVTFTFSEAVTGFDNTDIVVPNGVLSTVSTLDGGLTFTGTFMPTVDVEDAINIISIGTDYADLSGNDGVAADSANFQIDTLAPTVAITLDPVVLAAGETALVTFTFSEAVTGFDNSDITLPNGALSAVSSADGGLTFTGIFTPPAGLDDDTNIISVGTGYTDASGNTGAAGNSANFIIAGAAVVITGDGTPNVLLGTNGTDAINGLGGDDTLQGLLGDDILRGGDENDIIILSGGEEQAFGDAGDDEIRALVSNLSAGDRLDGGEGARDQLTLLNSATADLNVLALFTGIEQVAVDTGGTVIGTDDDITWFGASGNETFTLGAGIDVLSAGGGDDIANGGAGADVLDGQDGVDTLSGEAGDDTLIGGADIDTLIGGAGADILDGGTGADVMNGGLGGDTYTVDDAGDTIIEAGLTSDGIDTVNVGFNFSLAARLENLNLTGTANLEGTGNSLDNEITGNSGNNVLLGGAGNDVLNGGDGIDTLVGHDGNDQLFGDEAADLLIGAAGNDILDGGTGADRMFGQSGDDTYVVDNVGDRAIERIGFGTDTVQASISFRLQLGIERLELTGDADLTGTGNLFDNSLTGNAGDNRLLGGGGVDTLIGGDGNDLLAGQSGNDIMQGGDGNDLLAGSIGDDRYEGGAGIDRLFELVGQGSDTFVFAPGMDRDIIYGFEVGVDQIDATAFGSASLKTVNGSTIVTFSNTDTLVLLGIDQNDVSDFSDFSF